MNPWLLLAFGWALATMLMSVLWAIQRAHGDSGIVDVAWSAGVGLLGAAFAFLSFDGNVSRRIAVAALVLIWSGRLALHIFQRLRRLPEDGRYQTLKENWGPAAQIRLFWFYQIQAFWAVLFAAPVLLAARNSEPFPGGLDLAGLCIGALAVLGESLADAQLSAFRQKPENRGEVCQSGLWRYSRHPNYFFEWLHWWSYVGLAWTGPFGWLALSGPICMLLFLLYVTGIPPTEAQALKSRGEKYREYQRTTSIFFPWPPSRKAHSRG